VDDPARYEIRVEEHLSERWAKWFDDLEIIHCPKSGETLLRGEMADQPALFGALGKVRDLGLTLISVQRLSPRRRHLSAAKETNPNPKVT
jgi:hypothetical protein